MRNTAEIRSARTQRRLWPVLALWTLVGLAPGLANAQEIPGLAAPSKPASDVPDPLAPGAIEARRAQLATDLEAAERALASAPNDESRAQREAVREKLRRASDLLSRQAQLAGASDARREAVPAVPAAVEPSPLALDSLEEALFQIREQTARRGEALSAAREALTEARGRLEADEQKRREAQRALEQSAGDAARREAERVVELRLLASRVARERVNLRTLEVRAAELERDADVGEAELEERIAEMRDALARGRGSLSAGLASLAQREGELRRSREANERRLAGAELRLEAARKHFARQADPGPELVEEIETLTARRDALRQEIALVDSQLERLGEQPTLWQRWDALLRGEPSREDLEAWKESAAERVEALGQLAAQGEGRTAELRRRLEAVQTRIAELPPGAGLRPVLQRYGATLSQLLETQLAESLEIAAERRTSSRFLAAVDERSGTLHPWQYAARGVQLVREFWGYEITSVEDSPVTVSSLVVALFLAMIGLWASRRGSALVARVATDRFRLDVGAGHALQTLSFYALLVSFLLLALRAVHFPLTAFTVLGGALAIGIGFGSQNVMNNFISGLILMLERPVRARDMVEVESQHGTIEKIGARSTQIRSTDGRHIVVPNSFFLETNVVNWTLSDDLIRAKVSVGVIYGSPTRLVEELILRVVREEKRVLQDPAPIIIFEEFGDNSLNFDVYFWVRARSPMQVRQVQSVVRFRIDDLFREHQLVIAFPQRDVHLDSAAPIEVRLVDGARPAPAGLGGGRETT
jgi:potassium-dependent mechanosensitive channel